MAKKSHNVINIISGISVVSVMVVTFALITVLSAFNGLEGLVESLYESFDPDVKILPVEGKTFLNDEVSREKITDIDGVIGYTEVLEEFALINYNGKQTPAVIKGVDSAYLAMTGLDSMLIDGQLRLEDGDVNYALVGYKIATNLSINLADLRHTLVAYAPKKNATVSLNPESVFKRKNIIPGGIFLVSPEFDGKYILTPLDFALELFKYNKERSAIELDLDADANPAKIKEKVQQVVGSNFKVKTRKELNEIIYKTNKTEKWVTFMILTFILVVAAFNIVGSLTMLILDKKKDIAVLKSFGANNTLIRNIFLFEGLLINLVGAVIGLVLGLGLCYAQQQFGLLRLEGGIVDFYPIKIMWIDVLSIFGAVSLIGFVASYFPVRVFTKYYF